MGTPDAASLAMGGCTVVLACMPSLGAAGMIGLLGVAAFGPFDNTGHILLVPVSDLVIAARQHNLLSPVGYGQRL